MIKDLDLSDRTQRRLAGFSARIITSLEKPNVQKDEPLVSVLDDLLGAVYALTGFHFNSAMFRISAAFDRLP